MVHEVETAVYGNGLAAWHGLGKVRVGCMNGNEAQIDGGLEWQVEESPLTDMYGNTIRDRKVLIRSTDKRHLGVVSKGYTVVQNHELFEFMDAIVEQSGGAHYDAAGSLRRGEVVFVNLDLHKVFEPVPGDPIKRYLGASMGHNGTWGLRIGQINERQVCMNTVKAAWTEMQRDGHFVFTHRGGIHDHLEQARKAIGFAVAGIDKDTQMYQLLASKTYVEKDATEYLVKVFPTPKIDATRHAQATLVQYEYLRQAALAARTRVLELCEIGRGTEIPGVKGTWYGMFNAVAEHCDHDGRNTEGKMESIWYGERAKTKGAALALALTACA